MKRRAYSLQGYEVACCQKCGAPSIWSPCRQCQKILETLRATAPEASPLAVGGPVPSQE